MERFTTVLVVLLVSCFCRTSAKSCVGACGEKFDSCSCHSTCTSLESCCPDYFDYCIEILPYSGIILGGTDFMILNATFNNDSKVVCRFNDNLDTVGYVDEDNHGHCISPLLYETGWVPFKVNDEVNGITAEGSWLSVHTGKLDAKFKASLMNSTKWQYYGTPGVSGPLEMTWNSAQITAESVNIELWGYMETGKAYTDTWKGEWSYLYSLATDHPNNGNFSFLPQPNAEFSKWELGALRISSSNYTDGLRDVQAAWTEDHALAWHLEESFRQDSAAWALDKCIAWEKLDDNMPDFLSELIDCPCTLAQARADTGRFHTDYGCDIEKGSVCTYHPGSIHCVRAIHASPLYGAGQQCCYDKTGAQILTMDSTGGSSPDRAHDWGSPPFKNPPRVPGSSHWMYDVLSFYYCCLWSENCNLYFKHRPSSDCKTYEAPSSAVVFGDPHFVTFDGVSYSFNGKGEYTLVQSAAQGLTIQGRTEPVNETIKATLLTSVAMREKASDIIEVRLASGHNALEVLQNQNRLPFTEQSWMDLHDVFVFSPSSTNVTVMFPSGAGVEVRLREETMTTTVLLPKAFNGSTLGLLGNMNGNPKDDLTIKNGEVVRNNSNPVEVFSFGASWAVLSQSALFTYDSKYLIDEYSSGPRHDLTFFPVFSVPENPDDPLAGETSEICTGEGSQFCRYDILVGRSPSMGNATKVSFQSHMALVQDLKQVVSCGYLGPPKNGAKEGDKYTLGAKLVFSCHEDYTLKGSAERECLNTGFWSGEEATCNTNNNNNKAGIIAGSVIGALALIVIITSIVLYSRKQKRRSRRSVETVKSQSF